MADSDFAAKGELDEKQIYAKWEELGVFHAEENSSQPSYSLLIPPPNLTGELHLGHAMQHAILDAISRYRKLNGFDVLLLPGVDHAGIQFEATFGKKLARENLSKQKLGRDKWLELAWKFKEEIYKSVSDSWRMMGLSADWSREVFTLDDKPRKAVFEFFKKLWHEGLIYKGPYIVQWCPKCNTAIEDVEMEYEERKEKLYYVKYFLAQHPASGKSGTEFITVATARPETIFADVAIAVHPESEYKKFIGRIAYIPSPLNPRGRQNQLKIIADKRVDKNFGTGALKITPGHDALDYQIGMDNKLPIYHAVDKSGRMTEIAGDLCGLKVQEAREKAEGLLGDVYIEKTENYTHSVPVCERCKTVVEPLISEEWFVKMDTLAKGAIKAIKEDRIQFLPKNYKKILVDWLKNIHDWCISRSLWWGHRIPVWYKDGEQRVSLESPGNGWVQEEKVLDTWFSSGLWPLSTLGWPHFVEPDSTSRGKPSIASATEGKPFFDPELAKYFPWDFEISAPEIKYLWIGRMIMISVYLKGEIPFKTMFFHGMLRDLQGRKFSKSLGNGIEPAYLINNWGVDATRMALYTYAIPGRDGRVSKQLLDERGKNFRNFGTKIRNIGRFIYELKPPSTVTAIKAKQSEKKIAASLVEPGTRNDKENADDKWITERFGEAEKKVTKHLENLELHLAVEVLYEFIWHEFADVYIEKSKKRREEAQDTLNFVFKNVLIILHPFMPFLTEDLYIKYIAEKESVMIESWPKYISYYELLTA